METTQQMKDILAAIDSVKARAKACIKSGQRMEAEKLVGDLIALDACLVGEVASQVKTEESGRDAA